MSAFFPFLPPARAISTLMWPFQPGTSWITRYALLEDIDNRSCDSTTIVEKYPVELTNLEDFVQQLVAHPS